MQLAMGNGILLTLLLAEISLAKIIDLTHPFGSNSFMAPGNDHFSHRVVFSGDIVPGVYSQRGHISTGEHGGTHLDAPAHFQKDGQHIHEIPLEHTVLDGVMIDCSQDVDGNASYVMPLSKLHAWEKKHGEIPQGAAVIINFGWSSRFTDTFQYVGTHNLDDATTYKFPIISTEAAIWLSRSRDTRLLGVDSMAPDQIKDKFPVHVEFMPKNRLIVENVRGPERLPARGFRLHAAPSMFIGASGTQIRLYGMTYDGDSHGNGSPAYPSMFFLLLLSFVMAIQRMH